jgi:amidase
MSYPKTVDLNRRALVTAGVGAAAASLLGRIPRSLANESRRDELHYLGLVELMRLLHTKQLSVVEVVKAQFERISALDGLLHGYARTTRELALRQAQNAEQRILSGSIRGALDGAPIGIKDNIWTRDAVTAAGSSLYAQYIPAENAASVERLFSAGAVLLGKLTTTEFAGATYDPSISAPINPWIPTLWPGASSSGPGVAVAAGLCFGALGTDTGGSVRMPAAADGIVGFKPTWGRISTRGIFHSVASMDHIGPMARNVEDVSALYAICAGADAKDSTASSRPLRAYSLTRHDGLKGLKIGIDPIFSLTAVDQATHDAVSACIRTLKSLGAHINEVKFPNREGLLETAIGAVSREEPHWKKTSEQTVEAPLSDADYQHTVERRARFSREVSSLFDRIDVLVTPVLPSSTLEAHAMERLELDHDLFESTLRYVLPFDLSGSPALVVPAGFTGAGSPIGVQFAAQRFREDVLLQVGYAFEQATPWHRRHPRPESLSL